MGGARVTKMISLKFTAAEKKAKRDKYKTCEPMSSDDYDYSTRLDLSGDTLEKLGLDVSKLKVDQKFTFTGKAYVKSLSSNRGSNFDRDTLCLQMTDISIEPVSKSEGAVAALSKGVQEAESDE